MRLACFAFLFALLAFCASAAAPATDEARSRLAQEQGAFDEITEAFLRDEQRDLEALRERLNAQGASLNALVADLRSAREALDAQGDSAEAAAGPNGNDRRAADQLAALDALLADADRLRGEQDALLTRLAAAQRLEGLQNGVDERRAVIEESHQSLKSYETPSDLIALRERLRVLKDAAEEAMAPLRESRAELRADLDRLGPPPGEDAPAEAPEIAAEREALTLALIEEDAIIRQSDLTVAEIDRLFEDITRLRRDQFYDAVLSHETPPFLPAVVQSAASSFVSGFDRLARDVDAWVAKESDRGTLQRSYILIALSALIGFVLFVPARRWANYRIIRRMERLEPTPGRRAGAALVRVLARFAPGFVAGAIVFQMLQMQGVIDETTAPIARTIWFGFLALLTVDAGATAVFSPGTPGWRLVPLEAVCGKLVRFSLLALVFLFFLDRTLETGASIYGGNQEMALVQSAFFALAMALVFLFLSRRTVWRLAEGREEAFSDEAKRAWRFIRRVLRAGAAAVIVAGLIGYVALSHYAATRIFMLSGLVALGLFVRLIAHEAMQSFDRSLAGAKTASGDEESGQERLILFWIGAFIDLVIILILTPIAFLALGAEWADVRDAVQSAFFGFTVGNITISIAQIFTALAIFVGILAVTRFIQRTGEKSFFPRTRMDIGVQNSLKTLIGYIGLVIAFVVAVGMLGFNLSNLAIIAGALSVGIGFGLQSIVNNFVSGLILLFERPIKVGDWIVTTSGEGIVKNISVRSTEIETFDRSSVIVPNSELISSAVTNWTHKNKIGRVIIPVGVSYNADPEHVVALLEEVARESPVLVKYPAPYVYFDSFGDSSLNLELRGFIRDVGSFLSARTALRIAIFKKLKEAGVEIPFPQRDIHIKESGADAIPDGGEPQGEELREKGKSDGP